MRLPAISPTQCWGGITTFRIRVVRILMAPEETRDVRSYAGGRGYGGRGVWCCAAVGRVQTRRYTSEGLCCERWGSVKRRGRREDRAAMVGRGKCRPALVRQCALTDC